MITTTHQAARYAFIVVLSIFLICWGSISSQVHTGGRGLDVGGIQQKRVAVHGRWRSVRKALGLPAVPIPSASAISPSSKLRYDLEITSRFNLRRKREVESSEVDNHFQAANTPPPDLFFAADALEAPTITYEEFLATVHKIVENKMKSSDVGKRAKGSLIARNSRLARRTRWIKQDD
ncbi:hypothetical protein ONZ45_g16293 [Pleurotus djamor]|nr:hypothetical protein ONZ45_g16293 [Pleurotus djamor]